MGCPADARGLETEPAHERNPAKADGNGDEAQYSDPLTEQRPCQNGRNQRSKRQQEEDLRRVSRFDGGDEKHLARHQGQHRDPSKTAEASDLRQRAPSMAPGRQRCESYRKSDAAPEQVLPGVAGGGCAQTKNAETEHQAARDHEPTTGPIGARQRQGWRRHRTNQATGARLGSVMAGVAKASLPASPANCGATRNTNRSTTVKASGEDCWVGKIP